MMMVSGKASLLKLLHGWHLAAVRGVLELCGQRTQLGALGGIAIGDRLLRHLLQFADNLRINLAELVRILLLKGLQLTQEAATWRGAGLLRGGRNRCAGRGGAEWLEKTGKQRGDLINIHDLFWCKLAATRNVLKTLDHRR